MEALGTGAIIAIILAVLPFIAIIGTWTEASKIRKELELHTKFYNYLDKKYGVILEEMKNNTKYYGHSNTNYCEIPDVEQPKK